MLARTSRIVVPLAVLVCALLYALSNWLGSSNFGRIEIMMNNGLKVYVVREQWGLHSSGNEISVTRNPDGCIPPNPATDYIDTYGDGQSILYSVIPQGLILYDEFNSSVSMHEPTVHWADIQVSVQKRRDLAAMRSDPKAYGVKVANVPLNEVCWKNFLRKAGTSLRNGR